MAHMSPSNPYKSSSPEGEFWNKIRAYVLEANIATGEAERAFVRAEAARGQARLYMAALTKLVGEFPPCEPMWEFKP